MPATTELQVYNAVLDILGANRLTILGGTTPEEQVIARQWPFALNELLRAYPWNWAKGRAELDAVSPAPDYGWEAKYTLPDNFITLLALNEETIDLEGLGDFCEIEGPYLMTDEDTANIEYIGTADDTSGADADFTTAAILNRMDPLAMTCFQTLLASKVAQKLIKDGLQTSDALLARYHNLLLPKARHRNASERKLPAAFPDRVRSSWLDSRRNSTNG